MSKKADLIIFDESAPEVLKDLANRVYDIALNDYNFDDDIAQKLACDVALTIADTWGGEQIYICKGSAIKIQTRDMEIFTKFNGHNQNQLAREYDVSVQWVYHVIKRVRKQIQDKQQPQLPF